MVMQIVGYHFAPVFAHLDDIIKCLHNPAPPSFINLRSDGQEQVTQLLNGHSLQLEDLQKEHAAKIRELKEQQAEVAAKAAALKDQLDGVYACGGGGANVGCS